MEGLSAVTWRKSSFSGGNGGQCVEAGSLPGVVMVRDTMNRDGAVIEFSADTWRTFAATVKNGSAA
ncbi:MAG TPA: DUF397 domain-containing protein [Trebonia sp.]|jgi:hypothetical protein